MSQAGSQGGCLLGGQRNLDPNHTPPYTVGQPLELWDTTDGQVEETLKKEQISAWTPQIGKFIQK